MAISATHLTTAGSTTDAASYTTASIAPTANALVLAWVRAARVGGSAVPTLTGNGLTWVQVATVTFQDLGGGNTSRLTLFRALGASPSSGAVTIDFGGVTQLGAIWSVVQLTGTDTSGTHGSGAIVQSTTNTATAAPLPVATLAAYASASHVGVAGSSWSSGGAGVAGWTELGKTTVGALPNLGVLSESNAVQDTTTSSTATSSSHAAVIAAEIAAAVVAAPVVALLNRGINAPLQAGIN